MVQAEAPASIAGSGNMEFGSQGNGIGIISDIGEIRVSNQGSPYANSAIRNAKQMYDAPIIIHALLHDGVAAGGGF